MPRERDHLTLQTDGWPVRDRGVITLDGAVYDWSASGERNTYGHPLEKSGSLLPDIDIGIGLGVVASVRRIGSALEIPFEGDRRRPPLGT